MDFNLPADLTAYLDELDRFIAREIKPLEEADDNIRFFDHRREWARTDFENGGLPRREWEELLAEARRRADRAVEQLSEVFRHTLRRSDNEWAPLDQELAFAAAYLDVEEARFGTRLRYSIEADPAARRAHVPAMLVHTLIENAVKHGIAQVRGHGTLDVVATLSGDRLTIDIRDNGPGLRETPERAAFARRTGEQFGLRSVRDRLRGHFGDAARITLSRDEARGLTLARIEMPFVGPEHRPAAAAEATA